jgi:anaerobic selenocysteine-containing dehydrogenase
MSLSRAVPVNSVALARPTLRRRPTRQLNMTQLGRVLTEPQSPPVRALFVYNANPAAVTPNQRLVLRGLAREDLFTVVHEQVMTDTARFADIVLPATTVFEEQDLHKSYGHYFLQYAEPVIPALGESLSNHELFARLAAAMGFDEPELSAGTDELLHDALEGAGSRLGGAGLEDLKRARIAPVHFAGQSALIQFVTDFPSTASGKVELAPPELGPLRYVEPADRDYPLVLLSPATEKTINSILGEFNLPRAVLRMHPIDAAARRLRDGAAVRVYNALGEVHVPVRLSTDERPGVVMLPKGLWCSSTLNGATATALAPDHLTDIGDGACFNDARVEVKPLPTDQRSDA